MRLSPRALLLMLFCSASALAHAQQDNGLQTRLLKARATYYQPAQEGLKSFHCDMPIDWKDMVHRVMGIDLPKPMLQYANTFHITVSDDLENGGDMQWVSSTTPPAGVPPLNDVLEQGFKPALKAAFKDWNRYTTGQVIPDSLPEPRITALGDGFLLDNSSASYKVEEEFDGTGLLTLMRIQGRDIETTVHPTFSDTPKGRIVTATRATSHKLPSGLNQQVTMHYEYTPAEGFLLPSRLTIETSKTPTLTFPLTNCKVVRVLSQPAK